MRKRQVMLIGSLTALFFISTATTARAPTKPQEISTFEPVIVTDMVIDPNWATPRPSMGRPRPEIDKPIVIIQDLTTPKPVVQNEKPKEPSTPTVAAARRYAMDVLGPVQYSCIDHVFDHESNWNPYDLNKSSGAYGIPQALPGSKMAIIADDWRTNPVTQVKWGIKYVNQRYGSACAAWDFWQVNRWY